MSALQAAVRGTSKPFPPLWKACLTKKSSRGSPASSAASAQLPARISLPKHSAKQSLSKLIQLQSKSHGKGHAAFNSLRVLKLNLPKLTSLDCYNIFSFKFSLNCLQFLRPSKALRTNVRAMKYVDCCGRASNCFNIQLLLNF